MTLSLDVSVELREGEILIYCSSCGCLTPHGPKVGDYRLCTGRRETHPSGPCANPLVLTTDLVRHINLWPHRRAGH